MRRLACLLFVLLAFAAHAQVPQVPSVSGKAWVVIDLATGQTLSAEKADERFEPASLTKLMTAYVVFAALRDKKLTLDQKVPVSERAWRAVGSRMFIDPKRPVSVDELIRGMVVQSGNDACIALAEAAAGDEAVFAQLMNKEAERLGMKSSKFMNSSGLPDPQHYSTARDLQVLAAALIRDFPAEYAQYYSQKEFRYNNISQSNRNRLLWLDPTVDGVKTGYTEAAGYCLIASSRRGDRRLLSVLLGSTSEAARAQESLKLLNWGFQFFDAVKLYGANQPVKELQIWKGTTKSLKAGFGTDMAVTVPKGQADKLKAELVSHAPLVAPITKGQRVGMLRVSLDGKPLGEYPVVALDSVPASGFFGRAWDTLLLWFK